MTRCCQCSLTNQVVAMMIVLVVSSSWWSTVVQAADSSRDDEIDDTISDSTKTTTDESTELLVLSMFSFAFALCMSLVTVSIVYFMFMEDQLLHQFVEKGVHLTAKVQDDNLNNSSTYYHHQPPPRSTCDGMEYTIRIEYRYNVDENGDDVSGTYRYAAVLRKQLKCLREDMYYQQHQQSSTATITTTTPTHGRVTKTLSSSMTPSRHHRRVLCIEVAPQKCHAATSTNIYNNNNNNCVTIPLDMPDEKQADDDDDDNDGSIRIQPGVVQAFPSFDVAVFEELPPHRYIEILVLPGYPHSAIGSRYVERILAKSRLVWTGTTLYVLLSLSALTILGVYVGLGNIQQWVVSFTTVETTTAAIWGRENHALHVWGLAILLTLGLMGLELLCIHVLCRPLFLQALYNDYLYHSNDDGPIAVKTDDETLYTISTGVTPSWKTISPVRNNGGAIDKYLSLESYTL